MNSDKIKTIEVGGRTFVIYKMNAKTSLKVTKILTAKILPFLDAFLNGKIAEMENLEDLLSQISLDEIAAAIDKVDEADLERLIDCGLTHCYEKLAGGQTQVLNPNGTYGVSGIEDDMLFTLRLAIEAIMWSVSGFFNASHWTSMFQGLGDMWGQGAPMQTTSFFSQS